MAAMVLSLGSSRAFSPRDLGNGLAIWLCASSGGVTLDGSSKFQTWADLSRKSNGFEQTTSANRPASGTINGRRAAVFDGSASFLSGVGGALYSFAAGLTIAMTVKIGATGATNDLITGDAASPSFLRYTSTGYDFRDDGSHFGAVSTAVGHDTSPHVVVFTSTVGAPGAQSVYVDGALVGTAALTWGTTILKSIGQRSSVEWLNGTVGEVVVANTVISASQRQRLTHAMGARYGITVQ